MWRCHRSLSMSPSGVVKIGAQEVSTFRVVRLSSHKQHDLFGGLEHFLFFHILGIIIPTDELIFFRGVGQPPTSDIQ